MSRVNPLVLDQLKADPNFALDFVVDNNPQGVLANLSSLNLLAGTPQELTRKDLKKQIRSISDPATLIEVTSVAYDNEASNYTGGYADALDVPTDPGNFAGQQKAAGAGLAIFQGITALGQAAANLLTSRNQLEVAREGTEQAQIAADLQRDLNEQQLAAEQQNKVFGIPRNAFIVLVVSFAVVLVVGFISTRK
jgi:hypothetical protein